MTDIELASSIVKNFDLESSSYQEQNSSRQLIVRGIEGNRVLTKDVSYPREFSIVFRNCVNSTVYVGSDLRGSCTIIVHGNNSVIYIGDQCRFRSSRIASRQDHDFIVVGNSVTTTSDNKWISGFRAGSANPSLIIGDDCMFADGITVRNTDAHPIYDYATMKQVNEPKKSLVIEPHVWLADNSSILKAVTVGAGSVVALGSIVTRDIPKASVASGVPATFRSLDGAFWTRADDARSIKLAQQYMVQYVGDPYLEVK